MKKLLQIIKENKLWSILLGIALLITIGSVAYLLYHVSLLKDIENGLRLLGSIILLIILVLFTFFSYRSIKKKKKKICIVLLVVMLIFSFIIDFIGFNVQKIYNDLHKVTSNYNTYSTSIVTKSSNSVNDIKDIGNEKIGMISDTTSIDGYEIAQEIIKDKKLNNEIVSYDGFIELLQALLKDEIQYIFLPTNYTIRFQNVEGLENISKDTKIIYSQEKKTKKEDVASNKSMTEPFTILLMGIDSEEESIQNSAFNGDALILLTFNSTTLNTTILSIPRDTYVPISCFSGERKNKITHSAWYGEECVAKTIENFTGIKIDYYMKINFKGVVKLVDALGGVQVDVPFSICEQNSNREWGDKTVLVDKGLQTLNGEQALALARHREEVAIHRENCPAEYLGNGVVNDFVRGQNQQLIIKAILNQAKNIRSLDTVYKLLDTISASMETNISTNQILSFYNIGKDILQKSQDQPLEDILGIHRLYISGYDYYIYDYDMYTGQGMKMDLYNFVPYQGSIRDVSNAMKVNLGLIEPEIQKTFSFDVDKPYKETVIGKGDYNESRIPLLPNFIGQNEATVQAYGDAHSIPVNVTYVTGSSGNFIGQVLSQTPGSNMDLTYVNKNVGISITVVDNIPQVDVPFDYSTCALEENKDNSNCLLPDFVGKDISAIATWERKYRLSIIIKKVEIPTTSDEYDESKAGQITEQDVASGTSLYDLLNKTITITYMAEKEETPEPNPGDGEEPEIPVVPGGPDDNSNLPVE